MKLKFISRSVFASLIAGIIFLLVQPLSTHAQTKAMDDRHLSGFNEIEIGGSFEVYITQNGTESVKIESSDDAREHVTTVVSDGVLKIHRNDHFNWDGIFSFRHHNRTLVYISAKALNGVRLSGSGYVSFKDGIHSDALKLHVSGSGDMVGKVDAKELQGGVSGSGSMKLSGKAGNSNVKVSGSGGYGGKDLVTASTAVHVSGSGNAEVNASDSVKASVSGSGSIRYTGDAKNVSTSKSGSGSIGRY
jgi:hypothetical protein